MKTLFLFFTCFSFFLNAQDYVDDSAFERKSITIRHNPASAIVIDGKQSPQEWDDYELLSEFVMQSPVDQIPASKVTEVKITYTDRAIQVLAVCYDDPNYIIQTLKRDDLDNSDAFFVLLDPLGQQANGYSFGVSPFGSQFEALISPNETDESWDNRWTVKTSIEEEFWIAEIEIPFKTIRYKANGQSWRVNFGRLDPGNNEISMWSPVPRQFDPADMGYFGTLHWQDAPEKAGW